MQKILITGASGFVGSPVAKYLAAKNYEVYALSRFGGQKQEIADVLSKANVRILKYDLLSDEARGAVIKVRPDVIVHAAALLRRAQAPYEVYEKTNVGGTQNMLNAAKAADTKQFIYVSTVAVYGKIMRLPIDERHSTTPEDPYSRTKLEGENLANAARSRTLKVFIPRLFNVYGPNGTDLINRLIKMVGDGKRPTLYGDGSQRQDFVYIDDIAPAIEAGIERQLDLTLNVGTGRPITLLELVNKILLLKNSSIKPILDATKQPGEDYYADTTLAKRNGIEAKVSIDEGMLKL